MRKLHATLTLLGLLAFTIISCSKDNDEKQNTSPLIGKWLLISQTISNFDNDGKDITELPKEDKTIEFKSDNTISTVEDGESVVVKYKISGNQITTIVDDKDNDQTEDSSTFKIEGDKLTLVSEIEQEITTKGEKVKYKEKSTIVFKRQ